jgi:hypothetical protein
MDLDHCPMCGLHDYGSIEVVARGEDAGPHLCRLDPCGHTVMAMFRPGQPIELCAVRT